MTNPAKSLPLPSDPTAKAQEILSAARPASRRDKLAALAPRIALHLVRIRNEQDALVEDWSRAYIDEISKLEDYVSLFERGGAAPEELARLRARVEELKREAVPGRRNWVRWLRSEYRRAETSLQALRDEAEAAGGSKGHPTKQWMLAWSKQHLERMRRKLTAEALNEEVTGEPSAEGPTSQDNNDSLALLNPTHFGRFRSLPYLKGELDLPWKTICDLFATFGIEDTAPSNMRAFWHRRLADSPPRGDHVDDLSG